MAWQLHYTSARSATRSGFQFTAVSPGLPPGAEAEVSPYLGYRPPPDAPPSPTDEELAAFPVALGYDQVNGRALLVRSRYLGKDYSGRFGNFLAHAVLAAPAELEGYRPIEFWQAPFWDDSPADHLPVLPDPPPGDAFDPETLGRWLASLPDPYPLLARLLDALTTGHDRVILVSPDPAETARWIAVLTFSLPAATAARLSFTTYTADPVTAPHRLVGTTPDAWASLRTDHPCHVLPLLGVPADQPEPA
ncbi:GAP1-N2 domain-containing protein, partial [Actinocorallia lasiicapitis]